MPDFIRIARVNLPIDGPVAPLMNHGFRRRVTAELPATADADLDATLDAIAAEMAAA